jgi:hypothetical protein
MYSNYLYSLTTYFNNFLADVLNPVNTSKAESWQQSEEYNSMKMKFCLQILLANNRD